MPDPQSTQFDDFSVEIRRGEGRSYPMRLAARVGAVTTTLHFPLDDLALENRLQALQIALLRSGGGQRRIPTPEEQRVSDFGQTLFNALFSGDARSLYDVSLHDAVQAGRGIRIKLNIQAPELAALPWEFLYDPRQQEYVALSPNTVVVRTLDLPQAVTPLALTPPLRILGMMAAPHDLSALEIEREQERVARALHPLQVRGLAELVWVEGQGWRDLQRAMRRGPWHVFHFVGHGGFDARREEGYIALADENQRTAPLYATELGRLLADHRPLRLVLLNSCAGAQGSPQDLFSSTAATLVRRNLPAVLAMQYAITDRAAIEFAHTFYEALAAGLSLAAALTEARIAVSLAIDNTLEWGAPVLYMRGADGVLFDISSLATPETTALPRAPVGSQAPTTQRPSPSIQWRWLGVLTVLILFTGGLFVAWRLDLPPFSVPSTAAPTETPAPVGTPAPMVATLASTATTPVPTNTSASTVAANATSALTLTLPSTNAILSATLSMTTTLLYSTLDDQAAIARPAVGVGGMTTLTETGFVAGKQGKGAQFFGQGAYISFPIQQGEQQNVDFARGEVEFLYKSNFDAGSDPDYHKLFLIGSHDKHRGIVFYPGDGTLKLLVEGSGALYEESVPSEVWHKPLWKAGEWVKLRVRWDTFSHSDALQIYVNGNKVDEHGNEPGGWDLQPEAGDAIYIGAADEQGTDPADGVIDEFVIRRLILDSTLNN